MNCTEIREKLVEYTEKLLTDSQRQEVESHLKDCQNCRMELQRLNELSQRIKSASQSESSSDFENVVINRIVREQNLRLKQADGFSHQHQIWRVIMKSRITRFAAAAAVLVIAAILIINIFQKPIPVIPTASAAQVLTEAAKAVEDARSMHIKAKMRCVSGVICLECDFVPVEMWKKLDKAGISKWRIEEPGEVIVTDGSSQINLIGARYAVKNAAEMGPFPWYGHLMNVDKLIDYALKETMNRADAEMCMRHEVLKEGSELVLEIKAAAEGDYTNDYLKNTSFRESDHKRVYRFDAGTKLLKSFEFYVHTGKEDVLVFEVNDIEYNPQIDNKLFTLELPADVIWYQETKILPDNEKYERMTPKQAAEVFFKACAEEKWDEVLKFMSSSRVDDGLKEYYGGLEIISIGEPFKSGYYPGWFVPYEIMLPPTEFNVRLSKENSAGRFVITGWYNNKLQLREEAKWSNEPEILADNATYAKMSPDETVKAFYEAFSRLDWDEMRKFAPDSYVGPIKGEFKMAAKHVDVQKQLPIVEVGEAFWSAEHSAYFVKCRQLGRVKEWKLAVRNDNPAKRWVVDGGF